MGGDGPAHQDRGEDGAVSASKVEQVRKVQLEELDTKRENLEARMAAAENRLEANISEKVSAARAMSTGKKSESCDESVDLGASPAKVEDVEVEVEADKAEESTYESPAGPDANKGGCSVM